jgi:hypothetical protein
MDKSVSMQLPPPLLMVLGRKAVEQGRLHEANQHPAAQASAMDQRAIEVPAAMLIPRLAARAGLFRTD